MVWCVFCRPNRRCGALNMFCTELSRLVPQWKAVACQPPIISARRKPLEKLEQVPAMIGARKEIPIPPPRSIAQVDIKRHTTFEHLRERGRRREPIQRGVSNIERDPCSLLTDVVQELQNYIGRGKKTMHTRIRGLVFKVQRHIRALFNRCLKRLYSASPGAGMILLQRIVHSIGKRCACYSLRASTQRKLLGFDNLIDRHPSDFGVANAKCAFLKFGTTLQVHVDGGWHKSSLGQGFEDL